MINKDDLVHFCGIAGIGMSAIAKLMHQEGYNIQGSDLVAYELDKVRIFNSQKIENLKNVKHFVYSSAINTQNPELDFAIKNGLNILHRSDLLGYLMKDKYGIVIAGTHGKTTTTSILSDIFIKSEINATCLIGGIMKSAKNNMIGTGGEFILVEGDESDKSFLKFPHKICIVTNVNLDHMENYDHNPEHLFEAFINFINNTDPAGLCILCSDSYFLTHQIKDKITHPNVIWYSEKNAQNIKLNENGYIFDFDFNGRIIKDIKLPLFGSHNICNAMACIIAANYLGIKEEKIKYALATFSGVKRRFDVIGTIQGAKVIDDYAHHPVEIIATLKAAKNLLDLKNNKDSKLIAILQPHRYSRVSKLLQEFGNCLNYADIKIITDIYGAFEDKTQYQELSYLDLAKTIEENSKTQVKTIENLGDIEIYLREIANPDDIVIFLTAGTASEYARKIVDK